MSKISVRKEVVQHTQKTLTVWAEELSVNKENAAISNTGLWMERIAKELQELIKLWPSVNTVINSDTKK